MVSATIPTPHLSAWICGKVPALVAGSRGFVPVEVTSDVALSHNQVKPHVTLLTALTDALMCTATPVTVHLLAVIVLEILASAAA